MQDRLRKPLTRSPIAALLGAAVAAWTLFLGLGCGKVGDPVPRRFIRPATVQDLSVQTVSGRNQLTFSLPPGVEWVEVYRHCNPQSPVERFSLLAQISPDELAEAQDPGRYAWADPAPGAAACRYAIRFVDETGLRSEYSNYAP